MVHTTFTKLWLFIHHASPSLFINVAANLREQLKRLSKTFYRFFVVSFLCSLIQGRKLVTFLRYQLFYLFAYLQTNKKQNLKQEGTKSYCDIFEFIAFIFHFISSSIMFWRGIRRNKKIFIATNADVFFNSTCSIVISFCITWFTQLNRS